MLKRSVQVDWKDGSSSSMIHFVSGVKLERSECWQMVQKKGDNFDNPFFWKTSSFKAISSTKERRQDTREDGFCHNDTRHTNPAGLVWWILLGLVSFWCLSQRLSHDKAVSSSKFEYISFVHTIWSHFLSCIQCYKTFSVRDVRIFVLS
jgi:hypothetical protein